MDLRGEMAHNEHCHSDASELDVIGEYTILIHEYEMKQHLNMLCDYISERLIRKKQYWLTIWKKVNLTVVFPIS